MRSIIKMAGRYPWFVGKAYYSGVSFSTASQDTGPWGLAFKSDGTKMYIMGGTNDTIYQYSLSTAWDVSTAAYDSVSLAVGTEDTIPFGLTFKTDGTKLYITGSANDRIFQYSLTAWDLSTATYDSVSFSVSSQDGGPRGAAFKSDGTKMFVIGGDNETIYQYSLSTAWDVSTATYDSVSFSVASQATSAPHGFAMKSDGTKMYFVDQGIGSKRVYQYSLSTAWNLATASYDSVSFLISGEDSDPRGIAFKDDGARMYISGITGDKVYQYIL